MAMIGFKGKNASFFPDPGGLRGPGLLRKTHGVAHGLIALGASWDRPGAWVTFLQHKEGRLLVFFFRGGAGEVQGHGEN